MSFADQEVRLGDIELFPPTSVCNPPQKMGTLTKTRAGLKTGTPPKKNNNIKLACSLWFPFKATLKTGTPTEDLRPRHSAPAGGGMLRPASTMTTRDRCCCPPPQGWEQASRARVFWRSRGESSREDPSGSLPGGFLGEENTKSERKTNDEQKTKRKPKKEHRQIGVVFLLVFEGIGYPLVWWI